MQKVTKKSRLSKKRAKNFPPGQKRNELAVMCIKIGKRAGSNSISFLKAGQPGNFLNAISSKADQSEGSINSFFFLEDYGD